VAAHEEEQKELGYFLSWFKSLKTILLHCLQFTSFFVLLSLFWQAFEQ